jgi:enamine deaminase RidA (YjgF/YER057c/UK114 family)
MLAVSRNAARYLPTNGIRRNCIRALSSSIQRIGTEDPRMSKIVIHNDVVYLSGLTDTTSTDIAGQTQNVLKKVDDLLAQAGTSKSNLLTASIWLKDIESDFKGMNAVWCDYVDPKNKPVRATVQSPMARPQILVEIQVTAAAEDQSDWEKQHFRQK